MGWFKDAETWVESKVTGVDLAAEQARGDQLDQTIAQQQQQALDQGIWTQDQYDKAQADAAQGATGDVTQQVTDAAEQGAIEGLQNLQQGVKNTLAGTIDGIFGLIPWQLWILGGIALFVYLGGLTFLRHKITR